MSSKVSPLPDDQQPARPVTSTDLSSSLQSSLSTVKGDTGIGDDTEPLDYDYNRGKSVISLTLAPTPDGYDHVVKEMLTDPKDSADGNGNIATREKHSISRMTSSYDFRYSIWQIIRDDLVPELRQQLESNPELRDSTDNVGYTPIHVAAKYNRVPSISVLTEWKADPNVCGPYDMYPLHLAARYNSLEAAQFLLQHDARVMCRDCKQKTPLHHAARKGQLTIVELLLSTKGCDVDARDEDKLTPLHDAIMLKQSAVAKLLIARGADIEAKDVSQGSPLLFAAAEGLTEIMELILARTMTTRGATGKDGALNHVDNEGTSALHLAVQNNQVEGIRFLLSNGADVNIQNNVSYTPLHMAVIGGRSDIVNILLDNGANIECRDGDHMTPVHRGAMYGKKDVLEVLIKRGANINARTSEQLSPLLLSAWKGHQTTTEFLLTNKANIWGTDSCMRTALHWSVENNHYQILQLLIQYGGDELVGAMDHTDQTVAHYVAKTGNTMILKTLFEHGASLEARDQDGRTPLHIAAECGNYTSVELLIDSSKSETNDADSDGRTPLMLACLNGHFKAARSLLALGADNSVRDDNYCTALNLAASKGHVKVMSLLIDNLADVNVADKLKNTSLHMAAAGGHLDAVRLLLNRAATPTLLNSYRKSALDMAVDYEQTDVAVLMMKHKKWKEIMSVRDEDGFSPIKKLIAKAPEAAMVVIDWCVSQSDHRKDDMEYTLTYDFQYLDPGPTDPASKKKRYYAMNTMIEYNREELLSHPLTQSLLIMKWSKFGRYVLYSNLFMYAVYVLVLAIYMSMLPAITTNLLDDVRQCPIYLTDAELQNETLVNFYKQNGQLANSEIKSSLLTSLQIILDIFVVVLLIKELFLLWGQKWRYFLTPYTYINWMMLVATLFFLNPPYLYPCESNWRGAWISSLCAWVLLMSYLQRLDVVGMYFVMFAEVMLSITKVLLVLLLFIMAFAQAFTVVIAQVPGFSSTDYFPLTILAMTLGEINYVDNFVSSNNYPFTVDSYIILTLFMLVMPIALMNLLIGIAVGDIDKIQKQAYLKRIQLQSDQINETENRFPSALQKWVYQRFYVVKPNQAKNTRWARFKYHVFGIQTTSQFIGEADKDFTIETLQELKRNVYKTKLKLTDIEANQRNQQKLLRHLCEHFHLEIKDNFDNASIASDRTDMPSRMEFF